MFELGYDNWANKPDSANIQGFNHSLNFYFMLDFPFKTDPRLSMGVGLGLGSGQIYFNKSYPQIADYNNQTLSFATSAGGSGTASGADHYKRFKLVTNYLEIPVELRFALDPEHMDKSWKFAVGTKIGYPDNSLYQVRRSGRRHRPCSGSCRRKRILQTILQQLQVCPDGSHQQGVLSGSSVRSRSTVRPIPVPEIRCFPFPGGVGVEWGCRSGL